MPLPLEESTQSYQEELVIALLLVMPLFMVRLNSDLLDILDAVFFLIINNT